MSELLESRTIQFVVTIILGILGFLVPIAVYLKERRRKALSYETETTTPLLSVKDEIKGKLQILYENKPVQQVHLILIRIFNSGNIPIEQAHYERPVSVSFGKEAQILTAEVTKTNPDKLQASIKIEEGKVLALAPILLNGGDSITLKMLVSKFDKADVDGRIIGVKEIRKFEQGSILSAFFLLSGLILVILFTVGFFGFALTVVGINIGIFIVEPKFFFSCFFAGYGLVIIGFILDPVQRRKLLRQLRRLFRFSRAEESQ